MRKFTLGLCLALLPLLPLTIYAHSNSAAQTAAPSNLSVVQSTPVHSNQNSDSNAAAQTIAPVSFTVVNPTPIKSDKNSPYLESWTDTPIYAQGNLLDGVACAPTAVSMVMGHFAASGLPAPHPAEFINMVGTDKVVPHQGIPFNSMLSVLYNLGYHNLTGHSYTNFQELASDLTSGPVIITAGVDFTKGLLQPGSSSHALVVIGATADGSRYMVQDPYLGQRIELSAATFSQLWANGSYGTFLVRP